MRRMETEPSNNIIKNIFFFRIVSSVAVVMEMLVRQWLS